MERQQGEVTCPNGHASKEENVVKVADYTQVWRVRCLECRVIYSLPKEPAEKEKKK